MPDHLQGQPVIGMAFLWAGDIDEGLQFLEPIRATRPAVDLIGPMPYAGFQSMIDDPPGLRNWWSADYHDSFPDAALETFVAFGLDRPSPLSQQLLLPWGGALARVPEDATPLAHRDAAWITHPFAVWEDTEDDEANIGWGRGFRDQIAEHTNGGVYLNFIGNEGQDRIRAAFGEQISPAGRHQSRVRPSQCLPQQPEHPSCHRDPARSPAAGRAATSAANPEPGEVVTRATGEEHLDDPDPITTADRRRTSRV